MFVPLEKMVFYRHHLFRRLLQLLFDLINEFFGIIHDCGYLVQ